MPTLRRDRRITNTVFAGDADRSDTPFLRECGRRFLRCSPPALRRTKYPVNPFRGFIALAHEDQRIDAEPLSFDREMTTRQRIAKPARKRRLAYDGKFRGRRHACSDKRREREDQRGFRREGIDPDRRLSMQQPTPEPDAPEHALKNFRLDGNASRLPSRQIYTHVGHMKTVHS